MADISEIIRDHFAVFFPAIALLGAVGDIILFGTGIPEAVLAWVLLVNIGFQGILAGFMHWYGPTAKTTAEKIG